MRRIPRGPLIWIALVLAWLAIRWSDCIRTDFDFLNVVREASLPALDLAMCGMLIYYIFRYLWPQSRLFARVSAIAISTFILPIAIFISIFQFTLEPFTNADQQHSPEGSRRYILDRAHVRDTLVYTEYADEGVPGSSITLYQERALVEHFSIRFALCRASDALLEFKVNSDEEIACLRAGEATLVHLPF